MAFIERVKAALTHDSERLVFDTRTGVLLARDALRLAGALDEALKAAGVGPNGRVAVLVRHAPQPLGAILACWIYDRCAVLVSTARSPDSLLAEITRLDVDAIVGCNDDMSSPELRAILESRGVAALRISGLPDMGVEVVVPRTGGPAVSRSPFLVDFSTSGTTGNPKRMAFGEATLLGAAQDFAAMFEEVEGDGPPAAAVIVPYPIASMSGLALLIYAAAYGRPLAVLERFEIGDWCQALLRWPQRVAYLPPAAIRMVLEAGIDPSLLAETVAVRTGAAPLDEQSRHAFETRFGVRVLNQYGASEFCGIVATVRLADGDPGKSVGQARPGVELRIADPTSGHDAPGILEVRADRLGNEWLRTTDLALLDDEGRLMLVGRADSAINRGGFKVVPSIIEDALRGHPCVLDAAAVGIADDRLGEAPAAAVELMAGAAAPLESELKSYLRSRLLSYQIPVKIKVLDQLPRNASLKVDLTRLRALLS